MNKERTAHLIRQRFKNFSNVGKELIRAEHCLGDAPLGVYYFDFSQAPGLGGFDLTEYLQQNIASDFYRHEGSLQWNYYLYFVLEKPLLEQLRQEGKVAEIEANRTFTRKFLRDEDWLEQELATPIAQTLYGSSPPKDIAW